MVILDDFLDTYLLFFYLESCLHRIFLNVYDIKTKMSSRKWNLYKSRCPTLIGQPQPQKQTQL